MQGAAVPTLVRVGLSPRKPPQSRKSPALEARENTGEQWRGICLRAEIFGGPSFTTGGELLTGHCSSTSCVQPVFCGPRESWGLPLRTLLWSAQEPLKLKDPRSPTHSPHT